eukprot:scaffold486211_cov55-Prasinocladus_malaysianus.AAC.2
MLNDTGGVTYVQQPIGKTDRQTTQWLLWGICIGGGSRKRNCRGWPMSSANVSHIADSQHALLEQGACHLISVFANVIGL